MVPDIETWIKDKFMGYAVAIRREADPEIAGEPFISMLVAKDLVRQAVAEFTLKARGDWEKDLQINVAIFVEDYFAKYPMALEIASRIRDRYYVQPKEKKDDPECK